MRKIAFLGIALLCFVVRSIGQIDSTTLRLATFPNRIFDKIGKKTASIDEDLTRQTGKYLKRLAKKERKIQERLFKLDSNAAKRIFSGVQDNYTSLEDSTTNGGTTNYRRSGEYTPYTDSTKSLIAFAQKNPDFVNASPRTQTEINSSLAQFNKLQGSFINANQVKDYIKQRKQLLKDQLQQYVNNSAVKKYLDQYNSEVYYYSQQVQEYKAALNDPDKLTQKALDILNKTPAFQEFIKKNGMLANLFGTPGNYGSPLSMNGLQTKDQIQQILQNQVIPTGLGSNNQLESNFQIGQTQLNQLKDRVTKMGAGSEDLDMPDFNKNQQKTKSFLDRLEYGINFQTTKNNYFYPVTIDVGLSAGYKLDDKKIIGVGASYNLGMGTGIDHIKVTSNGISLRSFIDVKVKGTLFVSGGFEYNYQQPFSNFNQIRRLYDWTQSGLIGLSKIVSFNSKFLKKTKVQFLWDFLSYRQIPQQTPFKFRIGYSF